MRHTRFRRNAFFAGLAVAWAGGLIVTVAWYRLADSADRPANPVTLAGLVDTVYVDIDSLGIPAVRAGTELDAWRALGYLHATERLWQLEMLRRIGTGGLAELFGEPALATDRFVRTLGLGRIAAAGVEELSEAERGALSAYSAGVNARLEEDRPLPPEFQVLRFEPEPWTPASSLAVGLVMSLDLSHWSNDLSRHWAAANLPPEKSSYLRPGYPDWGPRTLDGRVDPPGGAVAGSGGDAQPGEAAAAPTAEAGARGAPRAAAAAHRDDAHPRLASGSWDPLAVLGAASIRSASNAWVVGPSRTAGGRPILANDMHLSLRAPPIWYVAAVHAVAEDVHVAGFTLPGLPGVIVGFNRDVAWGATNAMVDDMDFVMETLDPEERRYREGGEWVDLVLREETIRVRGGDAVIDTVRSTVRGPLISDVVSGAAGALSAMFVPSRVAIGLDGLLAINRAGDLDEFHAAAVRFTQPHLNLVAAGSDGRIGYHLAGSIPLRRWDGALPAPADLVGGGWPGMWSPGLHPAATDPVREYIATANNLQAEGLDGAIGVDWPAPFRALRITQALAVRRDWTLESTAQLQRDVRSLLAGRTLGRAVEAARRLGEDEIADTLAAWDRMVDVDSRAAPLFYAWFYGLRVRIAADEWRPAPARALFPTLAMLRVLEEGDASPWVDDVTTPGHVETLAELEERAMTTAIERVDGRRWGDVHHERHFHPLGTNEWLDRLFGFHVGPYPSPGGPNTVRPDSYQMWEDLAPAGPVPPWTSEYGPSERLVVEMAPEGPRARLLLPTGQSGNPFSKHYRDMNEPWREGELAALDLAEDEERQFAETMVLVPEVE